MDVKILESVEPWEWPEETDQVLLGILRDDQADEADRLVAAGLAGDFVVINDALTEALLSIVLNDGEPDDLRASAAISFGAVLEQGDVDGFDDPDDVPISEPMFLRIREALRQVYTDAGVPKEVRRRVLEASVRAPEDWHPDAVRAAYASGDEEWVLTAVFCMQFVRGFDDQILESLDSGNPEIHCEAVCAAGNWELDAAWGHVAALVNSDDTDKHLLLAAIEAVATIRPQEAGAILVDLMHSPDEDISDAVHEALMMAEAFGLDDEDVEEEW
jgi:hypothetical protein